MKPDTDIDPISAKLRSEEAQLRRRITLLMLLAIVAAVILIGVTSYQVSRAAKDYATLQTSIDSLEAVKDTLEVESLAFLEAKTKLQTVMDSLRRQYGIDKDSFEALDSAVTARTGVILGDTSAAVKITPRVYIHIIREQQRITARVVEDSLEANGYIVPGIQLVSRGPSRSELRVFRSAERQVAVELLSKIFNEGFNLRLRDLSKRYENSIAIRPGHFEIWFGDDFGEDVGEDL